MPPRPPLAQLVGTLGLGPLQPLAPTTIIEPITPGSSAAPERKPPDGSLLPELPPATTRSEPLLTAVWNAETSLASRTGPPIETLITLAPCCDAQTIPWSTPSHESAVDEQTFTG